MGELIRERYEVLRVAGRGGQGEVLHARDRLHDRPVALKIRRVHHDRDALLAEARVLLNLRPHPGITLVREDFFLDDDRYILVMDWIEGRDLCTLLDDDGAPSYERTCQILTHVADALDHLHSHDPPIVHKDVKPANIILTDDDRAVLVDFGIAQERGVAYAAGTPTYQAPEVARGAAAPASDRYALAVTAYELLTGTHRTEPNANWDRVPEEARERVRDALEVAMAVHPGRRPASARRIVAPLTPAPRPTTVALLFIDLEGSTKLVSTLGEDTYTRIQDAYQEIVRVEASREGGEISVKEGDGLFLVFTTTAAALRAAVAMQRALAKHRWPDGATVRARIGIHAGEARRSADQWAGLEIHRASRIADAAWGGQTLLSEAGRTLVADALPTDVGLRDVGEHRLKDLDRPERLYQVLAGDLPTEFPPLRTLEAARNNLPARSTSFIGRRRELTEVSELLTSTRLVTLTGIGGAGKTSLALQAAAGTIGSYPDGVWLVELGPVAQAEAVAHEVAGVLAIDESPQATPARPVTERLLAYLNDKELLLVLDNCEHVLDAAAELADQLLRWCEHVRILATSREQLGIPGEVAWQVPPLSLADPDSEAETDAERLFVERARAMAPSFALTDRTRPAVAQICSRLDGIPLAIELAASRVRALGVETLAARLDDRFRILSRGSRAAIPRQQTLEAAIDWSYELLTDDERTLFARLAVFVGGFTLEDAEEVCSGHGLDAEDVLDLLSRLVDKSLVVPEERDGVVRYRMLETTSDYAGRKLADSGNADEVSRRHRDRFLSSAEAAERSRLPSLGGWALASVTPDSNESLEGIRDNLQAALKWSLDNDHDDEASRLSSLLAMHWTRRQSQFDLVVELLRTALNRNPPEAGPQREASLRSQLSGALFQVGDLDGGLLEAERATALLPEAEPSSAKFWAWLALAGALLQHMGQEPELAVSPAREALAVARSVADPYLEAVGLGVLGFALGVAGAPIDGAEHLREALTIAESFEHETGIMTAYSGLFHLELAQARRAEEVQRLIGEVFSLYDEDPDRWSDHMPWGFLAYAFEQSGEWDRADDAVDRLVRSDPEGFQRMWLFHVRGLLRWMQGRLDDATADVDAWRAMGVYERWYHDHYSMAADVASEDGRLDDVRVLADEYLAVDLTPGEQAMKLGVLRPLVRAEVEAALAATGRERDEHVRLARRAFDRMQDILERFPPVDWRQVEGPDAQMLLAEAELSRVTGPDPDRWRAVVDEAFIAYWKLYGRYRLAEALIAVGKREEGLEGLRDVQDEASRVGAELIRSRAEALSEGVRSRAPQG